jgi:GNAT superfamily N-acetyltransferase
MAHVLSLAFFDDPVLSFLLPGAARRPGQLRRFFTALGGVHVARGRCWLSDSPAGAAAWIGPGAWPYPARAQLGLLPEMLRTFGRHPVRSLAVDLRVETHRPARPFWYLDYIGVEPTGQGRGAGAALLAEGLQMCDASGTAAYLNASSESSRALYLRHGFEEIERIDLPFGGPPVWRMWREPLARHD